MNKDRKQEVGIGDQSLVPSVTADKERLAFA
jgi:hypothetical protein